MTTRRTIARAMTCSSAVLLGCMSGAAGAANFAYTATLGAGHSDNIARTATDEQSEDIAAAGLRFSFDERSARLQADAAGNFSYAEYLDDTYDSELLGNFAGNVRYGLVPERFEWVVSDNFGQTLSDPFAPVTPDNRENINYFSTGPDITAAFGSQTRLRLSGRYVLGTYERSPFDFDTASAEAALLRMLSSASNVSLNVRTAQTTYDESALDADYDQSEAFVRYDVAGARTTLGIDVGYTQLERDAVDDKENGLLLRLDASRRLSPSSTATLTAGREFSNSGSAFAGMQSSGGVDLGATPGRQTVQPFTNTRATLAYDFERQRTSFGVFASWSDQSYEDFTQLDQTLTSVGVRGSRELSTKTSVAVRALYSQADFQQANADYDDMTAGASLTWRLTGRLSLIASYDYYRRSGDLPAADATENRFWLSLGYGRGTPRATFAPPSFPVDAGI